MSNTGTGGRNAIPAIFLAPAVLLAAFLVHAADDPAPSFTDEAAKAAFDEAKQLFEKADYKAAGARFRDAKKGSEGDTKKVVGTWIEACEGGEKLKAVDDAVAKARWRNAHATLTKLMASYGGTPLRATLTTKLGEVESKLFFILANYEEEAPGSENEPPRRGQGAGGTINTDPTFVKSGMRSLKWAAGSENRWFDYLSIARFSGEDFTQHAFLNISIYSEDDSYGKFALFFDVGNIEEMRRARGMDALKTRGFFYHMTINKKGWTDLRIDLKKELQANANPTREEVAGLGLLLTSKPKTIYIDDVRFEKE